jgi:hypothetical protein
VLPANAGAWEDPPGAWKRVDHHGCAWERVKRVGKQADPSGGACRRVEAWTAVISLDLDSERLICRFGRSVVHMQRRNRLRLHRSTDPRPRHHFGGSFGLEGCRWRRDRLGQKLPEELTARSAGDGRLPEGAPEKEREYRLVHRRLEGCR